MHWNMNDKNRERKKKRNIHTENSNNWHINMSGQPF